MSVPSQRVLKTSQILDVLQPRNMRQKIVDFFLVGGCARIYKILQRNASSLLVTLFQVANREVAFRSRILLMCAQPPTRKKYRYYSKQISGGTAKPTASIVTYRRPNSCYEARGTLGGF
jgi:hypothetical protein